MTNSDHVFSWQQRQNWLLNFVLAATISLTTGCSSWPMLPRESVYDPIRALGGNGTVYLPATRQMNWSITDLASATPAQLEEFYAPVIVQQRQVPGENEYQWSVEDDSIGRPFLTASANGQLETRVDTEQPTVYTHHEYRKLGAREHLQITYTVWYPRHPRTKMIDLEAANIDSGVVRVTLDENHAPIFYETVLACGCFHKVFVESWVEEESQRHFGSPESGKTFSVERNISHGFDWEIAGTLDDNPNSPTRPVVFVNAGEHKVKGFHTSANLQLPADSDITSYRLAPYGELESVPVVGGGDVLRFASIFNPKNDQQVWGADRMEKYLFMFIGTDDAGHPRRDDEILLHFDQSHWKDPNAYETHLRLAPGTL
jgi:hypothetical protein